MILILPKSLQPYQFLSPIMVLMLLQRYTRSLVHKNKVAAARPHTWSHLSCASLILYSFY
jgi:hypothetical protein